MKTLFALLIVLSFTAFGNTQAQSQVESNDSGNSKSESRDMKSEEHGHDMIAVPTVQCGSCVRTITSALEEVDGVKHTNIDLEKKVAHVEYDNKTVTLNKIEKAIAAAGYDANDVKRDENAHAKLPACCKSAR